MKSLVCFWIYWADEFPSLLNWMCWTDELPIKLLIRIHSGNLLKLFWRIVQRRQGFNNIKRRWLNCYIYIEAVSCSILLLMEAFTGLRVCCVRSWQRNYHAFNFGAQVWNFLSLLKFTQSNVITQNGFSCSGLRDKFSVCLVKNVLLVIKLGEEFNCLIELLSLFDERTSLV
jgi:hypothetical protein